MRYQFTPSFAVYNGDCRKVLPVVRDTSVDAVVTDPPYEIGFMGRDWDKAGAAFDPATWEEAFRVLKPGGHLLSFGGTRTYHRLACAIEDAGFEVRDSLHWMYGSGFPKGLDIGKKHPEWDGWNVALKPAHEPVILARKPFKGTVAVNVLEHGTGALNIDGCRVPPGRWPPNVLLTHSAACARTGERLVQSSEGVTVRVSGSDGTGNTSAAYGAESRKTGNVRPGYGLETVPVYDCAPGCPAAGLDTQSNGASRFFPVTEWSPEYDLPFLYQAKAARKERPRHDDGIAHPTVKPLALMRWMVRLVTPPEGVVLDPFMGTGTTLQAADLEGFRSIGCDDWDQAYEMALQRLNLDGIRETGQEATE